MNENTQKKPENLAFEERIAKIKGIIDKLNSTDISLESGMQLYKDGVKEINLAQKMLEDAKAIYEQINKEQR